jgi:hypothetical protein
MNIFCPMKECCCLVTIETPGQPVRIKFWTGSSYKGIVKAAKLKYNQSQLGFGHCWWRTL